MAIAAERSTWLTDGTISDFTNRFSLYIYIYIYIYIYCMCVCVCVCVNEWVCAYMSSHLYGCRTSFYTNVKNECVCLKVSFSLWKKYYIYIHIYIVAIGMMIKVFINGPRYRGSIPKTQKMALDASLLNTGHFKVRIKSKWSNSRKGIANKKGAFRLPSPTVGQIIYIYIYIYINLLLIQWEKSKYF